MAQFFVDSCILHVFIEPDLFTIQVVNVKKSFNSVKIRVLIYVSMYDMYQIAIPSGRL